MEIKETRITFISNFSQLIRKYCSRLKVIDDGEYISCGKKRLFGRWETKIRIENRSHFGELFANNDWEDIIIEINDKKYFDCATNLANEYEKTTKKTVTIYKYF